MRTRTALVVFALVAALVAATGAPADAQSPRCGGKVATIVGTNGDDTLTGTSRADVIVGLGGNDVINGGGGNDIICGNGGNDRINGQGGRDRVIGGGGNDIVIGGAGRDRVLGGGGNDAVYGGGGPDIVRAGRGDDYVDGGPGSDQINAGSGTDYCVEGLAAGCAPSRIGTELRSITSQSCDRSWSSGRREINGRVLDEALSCQADDIGDSGWIEYDLGRSYQVFTSLLGIDDNAENINDRWRFRVFGDGQLISSTDVGFGELVPLRLSVAGVLRLRLEVTKVAGVDNEVAVPTFASPQVVGSLTQAPTVTLSNVTPLPAPRLSGELDPVVARSCDRSWSTGVRTLSGTIYTDSLSCSFDDVGDDGWVRYNLSRAYSTLTTVLGIDDGSESSVDTVRFTFLLDGVVAAQYDVGFGATQQVTLDVRDGLRLELQVEKISGPDNDVSVPVFAEPTLRP